MIIGVLREPDFETRVSVLPDIVAAIVKKGVQVHVEKGAGDKAFASDADYVKAGAIIFSRGQVINDGDVLLCMHPPDTTEAASINGKVLVGIYQPLYSPSLASSWALQNITSFSLDMLPRTTRAQSMDVLSSQANIAGYKAVLTAAYTYSRYFPMLMTAAGSIAPAKVLILGAGVAGLQAIATAKRLGSVVEVFDTRPAVKEEVMSLGGKFVEVEGAADASKAGGYAVEQTPEFMQRQKDKIAESIAKADIVISTAQIPGKKAPLLITAEMIAQMKKGSIIIDLAAATGGNSALTVNNQTIIHNGVTIIGNSALPSTMPSDASKLYGKNVFNFIQLIISKEGTLNLNFADDLVIGCCITHNGAVMHERIKTLIETNK
jgi:proton-translocating NAD(P)+ transhydrogenase subunit alpha